jgi:hypothetical protein
VNEEGQAPAPQEIKINTVSVKQSRSSSIAKSAKRLFKAKLDNFRMGHSVVLSKRADKGTGRKRQLYVDNNFSVCKGKGCF